MYGNRPGIRICQILLAAIGLSACFSGYATAIDEWERDEIPYRKLEYYRQIYDREIFDYCADKYDVSLSKLTTCLRYQAALKKNTLKAAEDQFGNRSLAQFVYDKCLLRYPGTGVSLAVACVNTRIMLNDKIADISVEMVIFQNCAAKWRKHGYKAVHNCCVHSGNYYLRYGEIRE